MTYHDRVHSDTEKGAATATARLQLWLATISPATPETKQAAIDALQNLAAELNWPTMTDKVLDTPIVDIGRFLAGAPGCYHNYIPGAAAAERDCHRCAHSVTCKPRGG